MAEMLVSTPDLKHIVEDFDFTFVGGIFMPITIDRKLGDSITFLPDQILVVLSAKPSMTNRTKLLPQEEITIYPTQLLTYQHRFREVMDLTPEQQFEWSKQMEKLSSTAN